MKPAVASLYQAVDIEQDPRPLLIGERCNANGSKRFRDCLLAEDWDGCVRVALDQEAGGAHVLDVCTAYAGRDEQADLTRLVRLLAGQTRLPLVLDSTTPACIEACLPLYPGRCIVNSINLEDGGRNLDRVCRAVKRHGAAVFALTIDEQGMAMTAERKLEIARRLHDLAVNRHGLRPQDLFFDPLTFTVGAGDETLRDSAAQTLEAIRLIKRALPGVHTVLGLSNVSFGLPPHARRILNSVFLHEAVEAGLDAAIVDAAKILPLAQIAQVDREICLDLLLNRARDPAVTPLAAFLAHFGQAAAPAAGDAAAHERDTAEQALHARVLAGDKDGLEDLLSILIRRRQPTAIINEVLVPAMRHVGELFGRGEMLLPFVLQSAEVMKRAVAWLEPHLARTAQRKGLAILLATVQGDVHDIGKNLVDIILSNNGYTVHNIGIKVPAETVIAKARELKVDMVGLSGLLVKSALVMKDSMPQYREAGLGVPILLGGAALTRKFVAQDCVPGYDHPVVYCGDAFAGLRAVREHEEGRLRATTWAGGPAGAATAAAAEAEETPVDRTMPAPTPPFWGARHVTDVDPAALFPLVNEEALFRGRWGYRRGRSSAEEYADLIANRVRPIYDEIKRAAVAEGLLRPRVAYGYFPCFSRGDAVHVRDSGKEFVFNFPRRAAPPRLCIADYFKTEAEGGDVAGFFVVTLGEALDRAIRERFKDNAYHDYLMWHGFSVEVTDALAEHWHEVMRIELGIGRQRPADGAGYVVQDYQGSRYGFGYPACPDLDAHRPVFEMLRPEAIGVSLTENMQMVPEQSTSAIVAHHPQAKYFAI